MSEFGSACISDLDGHWLHPNPLALRFFQLIANMDCD